MAEQGQGVSMTLEPSTELSQKSKNLKSCSTRKRKVLQKTLLNSACLENKISKTIQNTPLARSDVFQCTIKPDPDSILPDSGILKKVVPRLELAEASKLSKACLVNSATDFEVIKTKRTRSSLLHRDSHTANSTESNAKQNFKAVESNIFQCTIKPDPDSILPDSDIIEKLVPTRTRNSQISESFETCLNDSTTDSQVITTKRNMTCLLQRDSFAANSTESNPEQNSKSVESDISLQVTIKPDMDYFVNNVSNNVFPETCDQSIATDFKVTITPKGKPMLLHRGHSYKQHRLRNTIDNVIIWKCMKWPRCPGMLKLKHPSVILAEKAHLCPQSQDVTTEVMKDFEIIKPQKSKLCLLKYGGYRYRLGQKLKKSSNWVCVNEEKSNCKGALQTQDNKILCSTEHSCKPDISAKCKRNIQLLANCCRRVREDISTPVIEIYEEEVKNIFQNINDPAIPDFEKVKERLYSVQQCIQQKQQSIVDMFLPENLEFFTDGSPFLVINNSDPHIMVFATVKAKELLKTCMSFVVDDTFDFRCLQFEQLFTVHGEYSGLNNNYEITPVFYALLPDSKVSTYEKLLTLVKEWSGWWNPLEVTLDFSSASFCAFQKVFPLAHISPCAYGFNRQLWDKVESIGLGDAYNQNLQIRSLVNMCAGLSNISPSLICHGWQVIMDVSPDDELLSKFYEYFAEQWLENSMMPMELWNVHGQNQQTNNPVEWWHSRLSRSLVSKTQTLNELVAKVKEDAQKVTFPWTKPEIGCPWSEAKLENDIANKKIRKILEEYNENKNLGQCLRDIAATKKFQ